MVWHWCCFLLASNTRQEQPWIVYAISHTYLLTYLLTYSMEQRPSCEANRFTASQEIPCILWNLKVHYHSNKCFSLTVLQHDKFLRWGVVSTSPNPQAGGPPLVGSLRLLIQYIHGYPPYWRLFLHLQPEDAPCHGDTDPRITDATSH